MNIKKKYSCFSYAGGNIGSAVLLLGAMIALFLLRGKGVSWSATVNIIEKYCDAPLILIAGLLGALKMCIRDRFCTDYQQPCYCAGRQY